MFCAGRVQAVCVGYSCGLSGGSEAYQAGQCYNNQPSYPSPTPPTAYILAVHWLPWSEGGQFVTKTISYPPSLSLPPPHPYPPPNLKHMSYILRFLKYRHLLKKGREKPHNCFNFLPVWNSMQS
jgi:hypothetical protein